MQQYIMVKQKAANFSTKNDINSELLRVTWFSITCESNNLLCHFILETAQ